MCRNCTVVYGVAAKTLVCSGNIFTSLFTVNKKVQDFTGFESMNQSLSLISIIDVEQFYHIYIVTDIMFYM